MRRYGHYCPIAMAMDILGSRWTLLILYELLQGTCRFNELERSLPGISRSVLSERLQFLQREKLIVRTVEAGRSRYRLTLAGCELGDVIAPLARWGARWALGEPRPEQLDPALLLWSMHHKVRSENLPDRQTVVEFRFAGCRRNRVWLVFKNREASVCLKHPGFEIDLVIEADVSSLHRTWLNRLRLDREIRTGRIRAEGPRRLVRGWTDWFDWPTLPEPAASSRLQL